MTNYCQKFLSKIPALILLAFLIVFFVSLVLFNSFLVGSKGRLEKNLADLLNRDVQIKKLFFLPPNFIFLKDVSFYDRTTISEKKPVVYIQSINCNFSLGALIFRRSLIISYVYIHKPKMEIINFAKLLKDNITVKEKSDFLTLKDGVRIVIKKAYLNFHESKKYIKGIFFDTNLKIDRNKNIASSGHVYLDCPLNIDPLYYNFIGSSMDEELALDNLELKRGKFYVKLWGALGYNTLRLNGYSSLSGLFEDNIPKGPLSKIKEKITVILSRILRRPHFILVSRVSPINYNIFDINCLMGLSINTIDVKNLSFTFNNIPMRIKGNILLSAPFLLNFTVSSYPDQPEEFRSINLKRFDSNFKVILHEDSLSGELVFEFLKKIDSRNAEQKINVIINDFSFYPILEGGSEDYFEIRYDKMEISYMAEKILYNIAINNFESSINLKDRSFKFDSAFYDGALSGEGKIDITDEGLKNYLNLRIKNVNVNKLGYLSQDFSNVYGRLNSKIYCTNYPNTSIRGAIVIDNGHLDNLSFFVWLSDFFKIPDLTTVEFNYLTAQFFINERLKRLEKIQLDSKDVILKGHFNVGADNLVSSILSLGLSKETLQTSSKFRPLLRLIEKDVTFLNFEFQLSGLFSSMNFKWLESNFKQKLQQLLPHRLEKQLQEEIEKITQPVSESPNL